MLLKFWYSKILPVGQLVGNTVTVTSRLHPTSQLKSSSQRQLAGTYGCAILLQIWSSKILNKGCLRDATIRLYSSFSIPISFPRLGYTLLPKFFIYNLDFLKSEFGGGMATPITFRSKVLACRRHGYTILLKPRHGGKIIQATLASPISRSIILHVIQDVICLHGA